MYASRSAARIVEVGRVDALRGAVDQAAPDLGEVLDVVVAEARPDRRALDQGQARQRPRRGFQPCSKRLSGKALHVGYIY